MHDRPSREEQISFNARTDQPDLGRENVRSQAELTELADGESD